MNPVNLIFAFILLPFLGYSQEREVSKEFRKTLELSYPNHFYFGENFRVSLPIVNTGFEFQKFKNRNGFRLALSSDFMPTNGKAEEFEDDVMRGILYPSIGYSREFRASEKFHFHSYVEINHRFGQINWLAYQNEFEMVLETYYLIDLGFSFGSGINFRLSDRLYLALDGKYSYYIYRYDNGYEPYGMNGSPIHSFHFSFGCGWKLKAKN